MPGAHSVNCEDYLPLREALLFQVWVSVAFAMC